MGALVMLLMRAKRMATGGWRRGNGRAPRTSANYVSVRKCEMKFTHLSDWQSVSGPLLNMEKSATAFDDRRMSLSKVWRREAKLLSSLAVVKFRISHQPLTKQTMCIRRVDEKEHGVERTLCSQN